MAYLVSLIGGLRSNNHRGLAFLECADDRWINAKQAFDGFKETTKRKLRSRFDYWLDGNRFDKYFHGWPNDPRYKECFVFKWRRGRTHHRLYGFLIHPRFLMPRFQVCILISYGRKNEEHTDPLHLERANELRIKADVIEAVKEAFPELGGEESAEDSTLDSRKQ